MIGNLLAFALTAFISVNGQVVEVNTNSDTYNKYQSSVVTDIGNPDNLNVTVEEVVSAPSTTEEPVSTTGSIEITTVSGGDLSTYLIMEQNNEEEIALMSTMVDLLAENSDSATGTVNSTILTLMDRMINSYPSYYKYAGFRTNSNDSYASTLYISKSATTDGNVITFGSDCIAVDFYRVTTDNYNGYIVYSTSDSPNASVTVNSDTIVYTNALDGYPSLGTKTTFSEDWLWIALLGIVAVVIFTRRNS